jgi:putative ABC transport system ATP-binding protein
MKFLEIINLHKVYKDKKTEVHALRGVSLEIEKGEFVCIEGPSGSGKTTLLNLIGGLDLPTQGKVLIEGENIYEWKESQLAEFRLKNIGFIFQTYNLIEVLTALENVEFPLLLLRVLKKERRERAEEFLKMVGLADMMHRRPAELSGGQQQRVAIARALVTEPKLVLADEPTANLDSKTGMKIMDIMRDMSEKLKVTFIFSSHDPRVIKSAKRVVELRDGVIEKENDEK